MRSNKALAKKLMTLDNVVQRNLVLAAVLITLFQDSADVDNCSMLNLHFEYREMDVL